MNLEGRGASRICFQRALPPWQPRSFHRKFVSPSPGNYTQVSMVFVSPAGMLLPEVRRGSGNRERRQGPGVIAVGVVGDSGGGVGRAGAFGQIVSKQRPRQGWRGRFPHSHLKESTIEADMNMETKVPNSICLYVTDKK